MQSLLGELVVVALKAENLPHQTSRKQDPFCIFRVNEVVKRTKADYGGGSYPVWDDQVNIPISRSHHQQMHIQIFDRDPHPHNLMGEGTIDLSKVIREKEHDGYFLMKHNGQQAGEIYLELTFYPVEHATTRPHQAVRYPPHHQGHHPGHRPPQSHGPPSFQMTPRPMPPPRPVSYSTPSPHHPPAHRPLAAPHSMSPHPAPVPHSTSHHAPVHHPPSTHRPPSHPTLVHHQPSVHPPPPHSAPHPPHSAPHPTSHPRPSFPQPRPSSTYTRPSAQPLLSAPYQPTASPIPRPVHYPPQGTPTPSYPPPLRPSYSTPVSHHQQTRPYPPPLQPGMRPPNRPMNYPPR
ncbi:hypothetical protein G6F32_010396 [Rhizopus arrhizus]|nr:hypothetical protein G6F24_010474 [Rhizopus arrhizus]KAG0935468.1 hypothetical protein G6F32_010396 [Rhizopus arrhizus]